MSEIIMRSARATASGTMRSPPHAASGTSGLVSSQLRNSARLDGISPAAGEISREISLASARSRAISGSFSHPTFSSDTRVSTPANSHQPSKLPMGRSEEHTSELQSLMRISYAVFCLKKQKNKYNYHYNTCTTENNTAS